MNNRVTQLAIVAFVLVVLLIGVSAYIRLAQGGLGCTPWPACYAMLGDTQQHFPIATVLHRLSASALGVLALLLIVGAWQQGKQQGLSIAILAVTVLLAVLGVRSGGLLLPAVVLGNFLGGLVLAILLGWLLIRQLTTRPGHTAVRIAIIVILLLVATAIMTGIGSSAFYGNAACSNLFDCGKLQSPMQLTPFVALRLDAAEHAITPDGAATLQWLHRLSGAAMALAFTGLICAMLCIRSQREARPTLIIGLIVAATATVSGLIAAHQTLPISAAVIHSLTGLFMVLVLLRMLRRT